MIEDDNEQPYDSYRCRACGVLILVPLLDGADRENAERARHFGEMHKTVCPDGHHSSLDRVEVNK